MMRQTLLAAFTLCCGLANAYTIDDCNKMLQNSPAVQAGCTFNTYAVSGSNNKYCNFKWDCTSASPSRPVPQTTVTACGDGITNCSSYVFCPNLSTMGYIYPNSSCNPPFPPDDDVPH